MSTISLPIEAEVREELGLLGDLALFSRRGVIHGVSLSLPSDPSSPEDIRKHEMITSALKRGNLASLQRYSSLFDHYFIGERATKLVERLGSVQPDYVMRDFSITTGCMSDAVLPSVAVYDPRKVGVSDQNSRIGALLRRAGIEDEYIDEGIKVFSSL